MYLGKGGQLISSHEAFKFFMSRLNSQLSDLITAVPIAFLVPCFIIIGFDLIFYTIQIIYGFFE